MGLRLLPGGINPEAPVPADEVAFRREVGQRVRLQRVRCRLSQQELAERAGVSRAFVGAIERGTKGLDAWRLHLIARELGKPLGWLFGEPEGRPR